MKTYIYEDVLVTKVVDGDTFHGEIDFGFNIRGTFIFRLKGIDTPETWHTSCEAELNHGIAATNFVKNLIEGKKVKIKTYKIQIYARYGCDVFLENGQNLVELLKENGFEKKQNYLENTANPIPLDGGV